MKNDNAELLNLKEFKEKISEVSKSDKESFIESDMEIINFDKVKEKYGTTKSLSEFPSSNDGLYIDFNKKIIFIEFKNAKAELIKEYELGKKTMTVFVCCQIF